MAERDPIAERKKFVEAWNSTMIDIWTEQIYKLGVMRTKDLYRSPKLGSDNPFRVPLQADGRFYDIELSQSFLEYGIWQDLGVGREMHHGQHERNQEYIEEHGKKRVRRRWFSVKYYSSVMKFRDFMAESIGDEFKAMVCNALDADSAKRNTDFYRDKGY